MKMSQPSSTLRRPIGSIFSPARRSWTALALQAIVAVVCLSRSHVVRADPPLEYLDAPEVLWNRNIGANSGKGNAVSLAPDERALYVTSSTGALTAIRPNPVSVLGSYQVPPNDQGWQVTCESGVDFYIDPVDAANSFLVFTVIDVPPLGSPTESRKQSRIVAINHRINADTAALDAPRWISPPFEGVAAGNPIISSDGNFIYFTRTSTTLETRPPTGAPTVSPSQSPSGVPSAAPTSSPSSNPTGPPTSAPTITAAGGTRNLQNTALPGEIEGFFTMLSVANNGNVFYEEGSSEVIGIQNSFYSPLGIARNPELGNYGGGEDNTNDILVWHSMPDPFLQPGELESGQLQVFQVPTDFDGNTTLQFAAMQLESTVWTTAAEPVLSSDGRQLFIAGSGSILRGWVNDRTFGLTSNFGVILTSSGTEAPPPFAPVFSKNETLLLMATTTNAFQAVDIESQAVIWTANDLPGTVGARPLRSPDDLRVYFSSGNQFFAKSTLDGSDSWTAGNYADPAAEAGRRIETDFALSLDGRFMYYTGARSGIVTALRLADPARNTDSPSAAPSTSAPTMSAQPTSTPVPSASLKPSASPSATPSLMPTVAPVMAPTVIQISSSPTGAPVIRTRIPTLTITAQPTGGGDDDDDSNQTVIIGAAVGGTVAVLAIACGIYFFCFRGGGGGSDDGRRAQGAYSADDDGYNANAYASGGDTGGQASQRQRYPPAGGGGSSAGQGGQRRTHPPQPVDDDSSASEAEPAPAPARPQRRPYPPGGNAQPQQAPVDQQISQEQLYQQQLQQQQQQLQQQTAHGGAPQYDQRVPGAPHWANQ